MSLLDDYFELQTEYEQKYADKTIVFIEKGMFYGIEDSILFFEEISRIIESYSSKEYTIIRKRISESVINRELNGSNKMFHFNNSY